MTVLRAASIELSGVRFGVTYRICGPQAEAEALARLAALEQSVELPDEAVQDPGLRQYVGAIESSREDAPNAHLIEVSYPIELAYSVPAFLSVVYSNISFYRKLRVIEVRLPDAAFTPFPGPQFGHVGIRKKLGAERPALVGTALKPVGTSATDLAEIAHIFAANGIEIIKDDHGLSDQISAPLVERVKACAAAVHDANTNFSTRTLYFPNVTGRSGETYDNAMRAKELGAGGIEILPGLCGFDEIRRLAADPEFNLPIMMHPANLGAYTMQKDEGMSFPFVFGQLARLCGADISAFPSFGGRFAIDKDECRRTGEALNAPFGGFNASFSMAGGGQRIDTLGNTRAVYGDNTVFLISGALFLGSDGLANACRAYRRAVDASFHLDSIFFD